MMHKNNFVVAVQVDGSYLDDKNKGKVYLPYNTEYKVYLKNKHSRRAVAKIFIDGEDVSGGGYIIDSGEYTVIERYFNGSLKGGNKFKFVSKESQEAIADGKNREDSGVLEVKWFLEKLPQVVNYPLYPLDQQPYTRPWESPTVLYTCQSDIIGCQSSLSSSQNYVGALASMDEKGCTVEGSFSGQSFQIGYCNTEFTSTDIKIIMYASNPQNTLDREISDKTQELALLKKLRENRELEIQERKRKKSKLLDLQKQIDELRKELG